MSDEVEYLRELAQRRGVACATVSDGHILYFKMAYLKQIVEQLGDKEEFVIFVQRQMEQ